MNLRAFDTKHPKKGLYGIGYGWWVIACLIYILSPIDLVPEAVLGPLGLADDAGLAAFGIYNFVRWLRGRRSSGDVASDVIEGEVVDEGRPASDDGQPRV